uniref:Uncharacterized protein n=1 Tax=Meleagris gallopavo TaxID=9103 RepID=A0A803XUD6_MELGA
LTQTTGGPMWANILAHENAISLWRSLMGPTKVNTTHGSGRPSWLSARLASHFFPLYFIDSPASASREIAACFPEFIEQLWYQQEKPRLRCGQMYYNAEKRVHCVIRGEETELT